MREEFVDILRFWLDRGVDGFRVDVAHGLVKAEGLPDWPYERDRLATFGGPKPPLPFYDQDGVHEIYRQWREVLAGTGRRGSWWPRRTSDRLSGSRATSATTRCTRRSTSSTS